MASIAERQPSSVTKAALESRSRDLVRASLFITAIIMLLVFSYANLFFFSKGPCTISSVINEAPSLYGARLDVLGTAQNTSSSGFDIVDADTGERIYVVWLGTGTAPSDGIELRAHGQLVQSSIGPVLIADDISTIGINDQPFDSPWSISVFRLFSLFLICFVLLTLIIGLLTILSHIIRSPMVTDFLHPADEASAVLGFVAVLIFALLALSEHLILAFSSLFLLASSALMIASVAMREVKEHWVAAFADALPLVACASIVIWVLASVAQGNMLIFDSVSSTVWGIISDSSWFFVIGVIGLIALSLLIISLRSDIEDAVIDMRRIEGEVR